MVKEFLRKQYRDFIAGRIIANGEALRELQRERWNLTAAGLTDRTIDSEIDRRQRRSEKLRAKLRN